MSRVFLIACAAKKVPNRVRARDLYCRTLFRLNLAYAEEQSPDAIHILSAKYGLVDLDQPLEPYNVTLNELPRNEVRAWAENVSNALRARYDLTRDHFVFLAGANYRKYLVPSLTHYEVPLQGLRIGGQLQWLKQHT